MKGPLLSLGCTLLAAVAWAAPSEAQVLPLDRLRPAYESAGFLRTPGAAVPPHLAVEGALIADFAWQPLVVRDFDGAVIAPVVQSRLGTQLGVALGLYEVASISAQLPVVWLQTQGALGGLADELGLADGLAPAGIGDLGLQAKLQLLGAERVKLAVLAQVGVPTAFGVGAGGGYGLGYLGAGPGAFSVAPSLVASYDERFVQLRAQLGYRVRPEIRLAAPGGEVVVHPDVFGRLGVGTALDAYGALPPVTLFAEVAGATPDRYPFGLFLPAANGDEAAQLRQQSALSTVVEWGAGARYRAGDVLVEASVGSGLVAGFGAADLRVLLGVRWAPRDLDLDDDGVLEGDVCPEVAEDKDGFEDTDGCPEYDNDSDGIPDVVDACPNEAEDKDGDGDADGCPDP